MQEQLVSKETDILTKETTLIKSIFGIVKSCETLLVGWLLTLVI
jgi:hypothetical protein